MTQPPPPPLGKPAWFDLSVPDAEVLKGFYSAVCGWTAGEHDMGGYADYTMATGDGEVVAGLCHARGPNAGLPPVWLIYVPVAALAEAVAAVETHGGTVLDHRTQAGLAVVRDPAGAIFALWQHGAASA